MSKNDDAILKLDDQIVAADQEDMDAINDLLEIRRDLVANNEIENPEPFYEPPEGDPKPDPKDEPVSVSPSAVIEADVANGRFIVRYSNPTASDVRFEVERIGGRDVKNTVKANGTETSYYAFPKGSGPHSISVQLNGRTLADLSHTAAIKKEEK